jgi:hypothetical protein
LLGNQPNKHDVLGDQDEAKKIQLKVDHVEDHDQNVEVYDHVQNGILGVVEGLDGVWVGVTQRLVTFGFQLRDFLAVVEQNINHV